MKEVLQEQAIKQASEMNVNIKVALIAFAGAIIGAVLAAIANYYFGRKADSNRLIKEKQKDVYYNLLNTLQNFKNNTHENESFVQFQIAVNAVCLYGDNKSSQCVKEYYELLVQSILSRKKISPTQITEYETKIINAMRKSLNLNSFEKFEIVIFNPPKKVQ